MGYFIRNTKKGSYLVNDEDLIGYSISVTGKWEENIENILIKLVNPEDVVVNVGANIGYHTIKLANVVKRVIAFEPQKKIFNQLCANIYINDLDEKITAYNLGLGDFSKYARMENLEDNPHLKSGNFMNNGGVSIKEDATGEEIQIVTLDEFELSPDFILMDAEGYEDKILIGSNQTLSTYKPTLLLEIWDNKSENIFHRLKSLGYSIYWKEDFQENYIAIHSEFKHFENQKQILKEENFFEIYFTYNKIDIE